MRILFFVRSIDSGRGGIEMNTNTLYRYFESCGFECFCIYAETLVAGNEVIPVERRMRADRKMGRKQLVQRCLDFITLNEIDIILNRGIYFSFLFDVYEQLKSEGRCRIIHSLHSSPDDLSFFHSLPFFRNKLYKRRRMYGICDRFVVLSRSYIDMAYNRLRLPDREKLAAISNPRPYGDINPDILGMKKNQVLIVSRLDEKQKNLRAAVRIWKSIEKRGTEGWELVLAGHGEDEESLMNYVRKQGLRHFRFVGRVNNPLPLYQESSIFMMTSNYEGFPTTLQESLQNGCVPVAFDTFAALHDMIDDGRDGLVISPGDEQGYAEALYQLMNDRERRAGMSELGMSSCDRYRIEVIGKQWTELFCSL